MKNVIANKYHKEGWWGVCKAVLKTAALALSMAYLKVIQMLVWIMPNQIQARLKGSLNPVALLDYSRAKIKITADNQISFQRSAACRKEPETIEWIEANVKPGDVFYDIGANVGAYSFVADKCCRGDITVYAFEPSFATFNQLCKNILLNDSQKSVFPFMICLSSKEQLETFNYVSTDAGESRHTLGNNTIDCLGQKFSPTYQQKIFNYSIDSLVKRWGFFPPNHIKLDVDGTELDILKGASETLKGDSVKSILVEISSLDPFKEEISAFLRQADFSIDSKTKHGMTVISNVIFKRTAQ